MKKDQRKIYNKSKWKALKTKRQSDCQEKNQRRKQSISAKNKPVKSVEG